MSQTDFARFIEIATGSVFEVVCQSFIGRRQGFLTEDGFRDVEEEVQKLTDRFVKSVDDHLKHKEADVMKV